MSADTSVVRPPYLFISYASDDLDRVTAIVDSLQSAGVSVWLDQRNITAGSNYGSEIGQGIRGCTAVALMCSAAAFASPNVRQEIMLAWKYQRPYLPLLLDSTEIPANLDYWLEGSQWIEVHDRALEDWLPRARQAIDRFQLHELQPPSV